MKVPPENYTTGNAGDSSQDSASPDQDQVNGGSHANGSADHAVVNGHLNGGSGGNGPGDEGLTEQHEDSVFAALDAFCSSSEQTHQQLLQGFIYLRPEDVDSLDSPQGQAPVGTVSRCVEAVNDRVSPESVMTSLPPLTPSECSTRSDGDPTSPDFQKLTEDILEEEVLPEGTRVPDMLLRQPQTDSRCLVKFDNFVEAEADSDNEDGGDDKDNADDDVDDEVDQPYVASFGEAEKPCQYPESIVESPSTGNYDVLRNTPCVTEAEEVTYDPSHDQPNPGEVTDTGCDDVVGPPVNVRCMAYSAKLCDVQNSGREGTDSVKQTEESTAASCSDDMVHVSDSDDAVHSFSLDEDFDYDNVTLTPKYTQQEMAILRQLMNLRPAATQECAADVL